MGPAVKILNQVRTPYGYTAVTAVTAANGALVVAGPGDAERVVLHLITRATGAHDTMALASRFWGDHRLSWDGRRLAVGCWGLWLLDLERRVVTRAPAELDTGRVVMGTPVWAPGDTLIAFP